MTPVPAPVTRWRWLAPLLVLLFIIGFLYVQTDGDIGRDSMPIIEGARQLLSGVHPYSSSAQEFYRARFREAGESQCLSCGQVGLVYPAPSLLLALPFALIPGHLGEYAWQVVGAALLIAGLQLLGIPLWLLIGPISLMAIGVNNSIVHATGLTMLALANVEQKHWDRVGLLLGSAVVLKPQSVFLLAIFIAAPAFYEQQSRQRLLLGLLPITTLVGISGIAMPGWGMAWIDQIQLYQTIEQVLLGAPYWAIPAALFIWLKRDRLAGTALAQVSIVPAMMTPYSYTPLLLGYRGLSSRVLIALVYFSWVWYIAGALIGSAGWGVHGAFVLPYIVAWLLLRIKN